MPGETRDRGAREAKLDEVREQLTGMLSLWLTRFLIPPGRRGVS